MSHPVPLGKTVKWLQVEQWFWMSFPCQACEFTACARDVCNLWFLNVFEIVKSRFRLAICDLVRHTGMGRKRFVSIVTFCRSRCPAEYPGGWFQWFIVFFHDSELASLLARHLWFECLHQGMFCMEQSQCGNLDVYSPSHLTASPILM